jgi:hypothetical protein
MTIRDVCYPKAHAEGSDTIEEALGFCSDIQNGFQACKSRAMTTEYFCLDECFNQSAKVVLFYDFKDAFEQCWVQCSNRTWNNLTKKAEDITEEDFKNQKTKEELENEGENTEEEHTEEETNTEETPSEETEEKPKEDSFKLEDITDATFILKLESLYQSCFRQVYTIAAGPEKIWALGLCNHLKIEIGKRFVKKTINADCLTQCTTVDTFCQFRQCLSSCRVGEIADTN